MQNTIAMIAVNSYVIKNQEVMMRGLYSSKTEIRHKIFADRGASI